MLILFTAGHYLGIGQLLLDNFMLQSLFHFPACSKHADVTSSNTADVMNWDAKEMKVE